MPEGHAPFAVMNQTANRAIAALLRSPLHPLVSGQLALITVTGRRSGRRHTFPVAYRLSGDVVTIDVGWPERKKWWRNLRGGGPVALRLRGRDVTGHAELRGDETSGLAVEVRLDR